MVPMFTTASSRRPLSAAFLAVVASTVLGASAITSVFSATAASAHADLVRITPERHGRESASPKNVVLEFSELVSPSFATVVVTRLGGASITIGKPKVVGSIVTQALSPGLSSGKYTVAFRVVSKDGHPVTGKSDFTLTLGSGTGPSTSTPSDPPPTTRPSPVTEVTPAQGLPGGRVSVPNRSTMAIAGVVGVVGLVVIGSGTLLWLRRRT